jgi:hypothetical protein
MSSSCNHSSGGSSMHVGRDGRCNTGARSFQLPLYKVAVFIRTAKLVPRLLDKYLGQVSAFTCTQCWRRCVLCLHGVLADRHRARKLGHSKSACGVKRVPTVFHALLCELQLQLQGQEQHVSPGGHWVDSLPVMPCLQIRLQQPLPATGSLTGQRRR